MLFLISVIDHETGRASEREMAAIDRFNADLKAAGSWVFAGGLQPPMKSAIIDGRGEVTQAFDGPLMEGTAYISGFWIVDTPTQEVARELAARGSRAGNRRVEVRQFLG